MANNQQISVTLPEHLAEFIHKKVSSGQYATESDVICESLSLLDNSEDGLDVWLADVAGPAYDSMHLDPSRGIPIEDVQQQLLERRKAQGGAHR
jgi:antitoxin ParD1/3/4